MTLNRRDFIGGSVAAAAAVHLAGAAGETPVRKNAQWIRNGLIDAGGTHEPFLFVVRRGGYRLDAKQTNDDQQSEKHLQELSNSGVEVFHTHLYKGFGIEAEKEEMEESRQAIAIAHSFGMKADTYIQWNSMMYETFFAEQPQAVNWIQRDIAGLPILLPYGYEQSYRYCPCFANQDYLEYLKRVVRIAIVHVKTDFIHFDNFGLNSEPDSCHCPACVSGFRKYLKSKYSPVQLRDRFGFERIDFVNPPQWNKENPPEKMQVISDPAIQEWIDYRCQIMSDALRQMYEYAMSLNDQVALEINPAGITGGNRTWGSGIDHSRLLPFTKSFWSEEGNDPGCRTDGRLISRIRSYKLASAYSNILLTYVQDSRLSLAEDLAFNQTLGYLGSGPFSPETKEYIGFYRNYRKYYVESESAANIAVFRSYASLTYNNAETQLCAVLAEQTLIQSSIPFDLVFDEGLHNLSKYATVILPNCECLSDQQFQILRRYVEAGGSLVVIGKTGLFDEWRRVRISPGLEGMVDVQQSAKVYDEYAPAIDVAAVAATRKNVGKGRVGYLPALDFDGAMPPYNRYFEITNEYWKRPRNWQQLIDLVRWASGDRPPLLVDGPDYLVANYTRQTREQRVIVHLVNYGVALHPLLKSVSVSATLPEFRKAARVIVYSPDKQGEQQISFTNDGQYTNFIVPEVETYALVIIG
jgi:hypothetical protein